MFRIGQSVRAHILEVDEAAKKFSVSLKPSLCSSSDAAFLESLFQEQVKPLVEDVHDA